MEFDGSIDDDDDEDDDGVGDSKSSINSICLQREKNHTGPHKPYQPNGGAFTQYNGGFMHEILNGAPTDKHQCGNLEHEQLIFEIKHLKNALNSKEEEVKNITAISTAERVNLEGQIDELKKRLSISEAEKERAHMNGKQTYELVVTTKQKVAEQENEIAELNVKIQSVNKKYVDLQGEFDRTRTLLNDAQQKYRMVEQQSSGVIAKQHAESVARHLAQVEMMQQQINTTTSRLEGRESELKRLQIQYADLQNSREAMLIDKSDTINRLTEQLEEAQRQCQNIMSKSSTNVELEQEVFKLRRMVTASEQQMDSMQRTINNFTSR